MLIDILNKLIPGLAQTRELHPHEFLFPQGDAAEQIFAVDDGHIKRTRYLSNGKSVVMHIARARQTFTEAALFSEVYHCNAIADVKTRVRMYRKKDILEAINRDSSLALEYAASLSREVQRLRMQLELHNIQSARERILHILLLEACPDSLEFEIQDSLRAGIRPLKSTKRAAYDRNHMWRRTSGVSCGFHRGGSAIALPALS